MISKFTWPNFVAGTPKDGTRVLIEECGFENDVKYGRTKIFIRTPNTLFALEKVSAFLQLTKVDLLSLSILSIMAMMIRIQNAKLKILLSSLIELKIIRAVS